MAGDLHLEENVSKKPRVEDEDENISENGSNDDSDGSEEDWQRSVAAQLAQEAKEHAENLKEDRLYSANIIVGDQENKGIEFKSLFIFILLFFIVLIFYSSRNCL